MAEPAMDPVPARVQLALMRGYLKLERQMAVVRSACIWTYMCNLDKFGLVRTAETTSKSFSVEFKKHSDAKNYIERERLGLLHLRIFDVWVQEVKKVIMENNAHSANCL